MIKHIICYDQKLKSDSTLEHSVIMTCDLMLAQPITASKQFYIPNFTQDHPRHGLQELPWYDMLGLPPQSDITRHPILDKLSIMSLMV